MASIDRTAYPRFEPIPHARELTEYFTPTAEEIAFGHLLVRRNASVFTVILLLKCAQYLGYFPALTEIPSAIINHVRTCLRLPAHLVCGLSHIVGSRPLLVTSGEAWYRPYFYTKETRTARP